jgi:5'-methylthioadenosine phosphorylase
MRVDAGIIGGTGVGERLLRLGGTPLFVPTSAGLLRGRMLEVDDARILLISRHSGGHKVPPHKVNYKAIASGLSSLGVRACFASAAVGSLRRDWKPGTLIACSDFLDVTCRNLTLYDRQVVHTDFSHPFGAAARAAMLQAAQAAGVEMIDGGVYICSNGPRYETPAEIALYSQLHGDVVGMTAATEAILMREAGVEYATLAVVTNLAAGFEDQPLSHEEVVEEMGRSGEAAARILLDAAARIAKRT